MEKNTPHYEHPLSWAALTRVVLMAFFVLVLWWAIPAVVDVLVALVLAASLYPLAKNVQKYTRLPLSFSILSVFLMIIAPLILVGFLIATSFNTQFPELMTSLSATLDRIPYISHTLASFNIMDYARVHSSYLWASSQSIVLTTVSTVTVIILSFYFMFDHERLLALFLDVFPYGEKQKLRGLLGEVGRVTGQYIRGNVLISIISAAFIFVGLTALHVPFALPLALFSGILDLLPLVGFTIGAIPSLLVAFAVSPWKCLAVLALYLVYQQIENALISPMIYNKALNLYPALGFLAVLLGGSVFGILGAFLALPIAASVPVVVKYLEDYK